MSSKYVSNDIVTIGDDREYYLNLPHLVVGSIDTFSTTKMVLEDNTLRQKEIIYNQCFIKQIEEAIQNSCDEFKRTNGDYANRIEINIDKKSGLISVQDNGRGIPLDSYVLSATNFKTGSNFTWLKEDSASNKNIGAHGIGSKLISLFSTHYKMVTITDKGRGELVCKDNMLEIEHKESKRPKNATNGTYIEWIPDYKRMQLDSIHEDLIHHMEALLINMAVSFPDIDFIFNGKSIKIKQFKDYVKFVSDKASILLDSEDISLAVYPTQEPSFIHIVNSIDINKGGSALTYISNSLISKFGDRLRKGYSKITNSHVKNKIGIILILRNMENLKFGAGQTKEELKNSVKELGLPTLDYQSFSEILYKNTAIRSPIIDFFKIQQELENRQKLKDMGAKKIKRVEKFFPATKEKKFLYLSEGESAKGLLMNLKVGITRDTSSFYSLLGKPLNVCNASNLQVANNKVIQDFVSIFETPLNGDVKTFSHDFVVIASDSDADGIGAISGGLIMFFAKFYPELIKQGRLKKLYLPLIVVFDNKDRIVEYFQDFPTYSAWLSKIKDAEKYRIDYYKGLGGFDSDTINYLFEKYGFETFLDDVEWDSNTLKTLNNWLSKDSVEFRKQALTAEDAILDIGLV